MLSRKTSRKLHHTFAKIVSAFFLTLYFLRRLADFKIFECFICTYQYEYNCGGVIIGRTADTTDVSVVKSLTCSYRMTHTLFGCGWHKHISNGLKSCNWFQLDIQIRIILTSTLVSTPPTLFAIKPAVQCRFIPKGLHCPQKVVTKHPSSKLSRPFLSQQNQQLRNVTLASSSNISLQTNNANQCHVTIWSKDG